MYAETSQVEQYETVTEQSKIPDSIRLWYGHLANSHFFNTLPCNNTGAEQGFIEFMNMDYKNSSY